MGDGGGQGESTGAAGEAVRQQGEGRRVRSCSWDLLPFLQVLVITNMNHRLVLPIAFLRKIVRD